MNGYSVLRSPKSIYFGNGVRSLLGEVASEFGSNALICFDPWLAGSAILAEIQSDLTRAGLEPIGLVASRPDFSTDYLDEAVASCADSAIDLIVGVGGGSTLDLAKLIAVLLQHAPPIDRYYGEFEVPGPVLPIIALPTTSGTGSEVTPVAVITDSTRVMKVGVSDPRLIPTVALCDPELTLTCPPTITAHAGVDALSHAIESFTASRRTQSAARLRREVFLGQNPLSDAYALEAVGLLSRHLPGAVADGADRIHRRGCQLGSLQAGLAFAQTGTGAAHALQYPIGAATSTAHGLGVGLLLPYVMAYNLPAASTRLSAVAHAAGVADPEAPDVNAAAAAVMWVVELNSWIGLPGSLADIGVARADLPNLARLAGGIDRLLKNNARAIDERGLLTVLEAAWAGNPEMILNKNT